jgi:hypothetical protein
VNLYQLTTKVEIPQGVNLKAVPFPIKRYLG